MSKKIIPEEEDIIKYSAAEKVEEGKGKYHDFFYVAVVLLVAVLGFGLGRLSKIESSKTPITIEYPEDSPETAQNSPKTVQDDHNRELARSSNYSSSSPIVASKNGTKYYFTWCSGASRITAKNRVYFSTATSAETAGFSKASNCPGL
ncbi:MAG: hypothetical protein HZA95_01330 [Candidatus Vogelbacteria bacterium]|nr:hypothetical protein [Candidatus Vogelbacteria bacterium]